MWAVCPWWIGKDKAKYLLQNEVLYLVMRGWIATPHEELTATDMDSDDSDNEDIILQ